MRGRWPCAEIDWVQTVLRLAADVSETPMNIAVSGRARLTNRARARKENGQLLVAR